VIFSLCYFAAGLIPTNAAEGQPTPVLDHASVMVQLVIFPVLSVLLLIHWRELAQAIRRSGWLIALISMALASVTWSTHPMFTLRRAVILLGTTMFALYLASCHDSEEQMNLFGWAVVLEVLASIVVIVLFPKFGISHGGHWGDWRGMFSHKNVLGRFMAFGVLLLLFGKPKGIPVWLRVSCLTGAFIMLVESGSATSQIALAAVLSIYPVLQTVRIRQKKTLPLWAALLPLLSPVAVILIVNYSTILEFFGRNATLTGRTFLWAVISAAIAKRPWLGYGYSAFWAHNSLEKAALASLVGWEAPSAHNAYLDASLDLGRIGLAVLLTGYAVTVGRGIKRFQAGGLGAPAWPLMYLLFFAACNFTESNMLQARAFLWLPYVATYITLARFPSNAPGEMTESQVPPCDRS
jgi:exopolysaccharide production protein ExoQ